MKKLFVIVALAFSVTVAHAGAFVKVSPVKFGLGLNAGTNGVGLDASLGLTRFVQVRAGFSLVPNYKIKYKANIYNDIQDFSVIWNAANPSNPLPDLPQKMPSIIQPHMTTAHALLDLYALGGFHITVGAYFGKNNPVQAWNTDKNLAMDIYNVNECIDGVNKDLPESAQKHHIGVQLGDYLFVPDSEGNMNIETHINKVRPYIGIGLGRAVPRKSRLGCSLDLGVQYWGKPKYTCNGEEVERADLKSKMYVKMATTLPVYPTLTFRICGRFF